MRGVIVLICGSAWTCVYTPLELVDAEGDAPIAIIDGGPTIPVGHNARVLLDGSSSFDPNGDSLTYAWSYVGACAAAVAQRAAEPWIYELITTDVGSTCRVTLVVADPTGHEDEAVAEVNVVEVGAFVANAAGCVNQSDAPEGFFGRGLPAKPWCTLRDGLAAAAAFRLVEVRVSADLQHDTEPLIVPPGRAVLGGHTFPGWAQELQGMTPVALDGDAAIELAPGTGTVLRSLNVYRTSACAADCALIDGRDASFHLASSVVGHDLTGGNSLTGEHTARLWTVRAVSETRPISVLLTGVTIAMATRGEEVYGLLLDGRGVSATGRVLQTLVDGRVDANYAAGLQLLATDQVVVEDTVVTVSSIWASSAMIGGIVDGLCGAVSPSHEPCDAVTCAGSRRLTLTGVHAAVHTELESSSPDSSNVALALCGSEQVNVTSTLPGDSSFEVESRTQAVGLLTVETRGVRVRATHSELLPIRATLGDNAQSSAEAALAGAWIDGLPQLLASGGQLVEYQGGSEWPRLEQVTLRAAFAAVRTQPGSLIGAGLFGTRGAAGIAVLDGVDVAVVPEVGAPPATRAIALWTAGTEELLLLNVRCRSTSPVVAQLCAACWLDGEPTEDDFGSYRIVLRGAHLASPFAAETQACVLLAGTQEGELGESALGCAPTSEWSPLMVQVATTATREVLVRGNWIGTGFELSSSTDSSTWAMVGVQDGGVSVTGAEAPGSAELALVRNVIFPGADRFHSLTGVRVTHGSQSSATPVQGEVFLFDNAVLGYVNESWTGIVIDGASATVVHNTLRGSPCAEMQVPCLAPQFGYALQVLNSAPSSDQFVIVANNLLDAGEAGFSVIVTSQGMQYSSSGISDLGLDVLQRNVFWNLHGTGCFLAPFAVGPPECVGYSVQLASTLAIFAFDGVVLPRGGDVFCADRYHLSPVVDLADIVDFADARYRRDYDVDGEARGSEADIGADERGVCPPD